MKNVKVLGTGCAKCTKLFEAVRRVGDGLEVPIEVEKVEDIGRIVEYGVMMTPALVVDEKVVSSGRILSDDEIAKLLST
ncbi:MAG: TM0996/MTH895 family glutaredoxin-like protein [Candidatus Krumholzibacteriota bacterium]|nr:TM0996/MTH895 family glutaredoxin-like protein [Candidatus Krumholzibacteriota bacterium]